jgi:hypothetical protein
MFQVFGRNKNAGRDDGPCKRAASGLINAEHRKAEFRIEGAAGYTAASL